METHREGIEDENCQTVPNGKHHEKPGIAQLGECVERRLNRTVIFPGQPVEERIEDAGGEQRAKYTLEADKHPRRSRDVE
eukprot:scaffold100277_cov30-Tisochrysis_lutea.AAC.2